MNMYHGLLSWGFLIFFSSCWAQFPPSNSSTSNITTINSPINSNISISFNSPPPGTCTTVFSTQQQYTGHITIPPNTIPNVQQNYTVNAFFWFIEARSNPQTAPLTVWFTGGPGSSSMVGLFQEHGPCEAVEIAENQLGTQARDWGWDRSSNIVYIDQPVQVGFSYDTPTNGSLDLISGNFTFPATGLPSGQQPDTFLNGTFSSNQITSTENTTQIAAITVWHMLQGFLSTFPQYNPGSRSNSTQPGAVGVNLFTESYGGKYGPAFASYWEEQNSLRSNGSLPKNTTLVIQLKSLGIINGCVDDLIQAEFYPTFASNNTYGIQAISTTDAAAVIGSYLDAGGCKEAINACRAAASSYDPNDYGAIVSVNQLCKSAQLNCQNNIIEPYMASGRSVYDITHLTPDPFPPSTYLEYLNTVTLQEAIGAVVNYTESSAIVSNAFLSTGDWERGGQIADFAYLLSLGVRVAFIYGDRDYICNWLGGEAVSFSVAAQASSYSKFYSAGYAPIQVNDSYVGGAVREFGNLSFSRIYDAGHLVAAYQPETAFTVFTRIIMGTDVATGESVNLTTFATNGTANATYTSTAPSSPSPTCWIRNIADTCTDDDLQMIEQGQGVIINGVLYSKESDWKPPASSVVSQAGVPGSYPTTSISQSSSSTSGSTSSTSVSVTTTVPTGVYVATGPPSPTNTKKGAASGKKVNYMFLAFTIGVICTVWEFI